MNNKVYNKENIPGAQDVSRLEPPRPPLLLLLVSVGCRGLVVAFVGYRGPALGFVGLLGLVW